MDFSYEHLPAFCFYYSLVGHQKKSCNSKMTESQSGQVCEDQFGKWLRAKTFKMGKMVRRLLIKRKNKGG